MTTCVVDHLRADRALAASLRAARKQVHPAFFEARLEAEALAAAAASASALVDPVTGHDVATAGPPGWSTARAGPEEFADADPLWPAAAATPAPARARSVAATAVACTGQVSAAASDEPLTSGASTAEAPVPERSLAGVARVLSFDEPDPVSWDSLTLAETVHAFDAWTVTRARYGGRNVLYASCHALESSSSVFRLQMQSATRAALAQLSPFCHMRLIGFVSEPGKGGLVLAETATASRGAPGFMTELRNATDIALRIAELFRALHAAGIANLQLVPTASPPHPS